MESRDNVNRSENVIDITIRNGGASSFTAPHSTISGSNPRRSTSASSSSRADRRSPLDSALWIPIELIITMSQIVAAIVVLCLSKRELPHALLLFLWNVGYASGCAATLPILYWRYCHSNQNPQLNFPAGPFCLTPSGTSELLLTSNPRVKVLMEYFKKSLDCIFALWFGIGNDFVIRGHVSASEAPNLYRLCIVFLAINWIYYVAPIILFCCCWVISILGYREETAQNRGATAESKNSLPTTYEFKITKNINGDDAIEGERVVAARTSKERLISREDAMITGELLSIKPQEIQFPFELKKQISTSLRLSNNTDNYVAFKVKTTNPNNYCVRPKIGIVLPRSTCDVTVTMQAQREAPPDMQCKDTFLLQSVIASPGATVKDITREMFNKKVGNLVEEYKLRVVYVHPPRRLPPVQSPYNGNAGAAEFSQAPRTLSERNEYQDSSLEVIFVGVVVAGVGGSATAFGGGVAPAAEEK